MLNRIRHALRRDSSQQHTVSIPLEPLAQSVKKSPFLWMDYRNGNPEWHIADYDAYANEGYSLNAVIHSAIAYKERAIASARLEAVKGDPDNPERLPLSHPLAKLCARPNPYQSWEQFQRQRVVYLNLAGNCYTYLDRPSRAAPPTALYNLRPDRTFIVPDNQGGLRGYYYTRDRDANPQVGLPVLVNDMMHPKFSNPQDPLEGLGYGLSPIMALAQSGDVDNQVTAFLKLFFESGAMPSGLLSFDMDMDGDQIARAREIWNERYGGVENWTDVAVLDKNGKYQRIGLTFDEMGFEALDERNETRILAPFGVPPILLGTRTGLNRSTMANYEESRRQCWEDTLVPEIRLLESVDQYYLQTDDGGYVRYDLSTVPALQKDTPKLVDAAYKLFTMGVPRDQALAEVGLRFEETPGGDISYLPVGMMPAGDSPSPAPEPPDNGDDDSMDDPLIGVDEDERQPDKALLPSPNEPRQRRITRARQWSEDEKAQLWTKADALATGHEAAFRREAAAQFSLDMRAVLAVVGDMKRASLQRKAAIQWEMLFDDVQKILSDAGARWREAFTPLVKGVVMDAAEHWQAAAGMAFDVTNLEAVQWFNDYTLQFSTAIQATSEREIAALLQQGAREGWSVPQMQRGLTQMFQQWIDGGVDAADFAGERLPPYRAEAIARTETIRAANAGSEAIYRANAVERKEWLAAIDSRTRDSHAIASGQIVGMDEAFQVGGFAMRYPGDPNAPPGETVNCRCVVLPVMAVE